MHSWGLSSLKAEPFKERKDEGKRELSRTGGNKTISTLILTLKNQQLEEGSRLGARQAAFFRTIWMQAEMTNNVLPELELKWRIISAVAQSKPCTVFSDPSCRPVSRCQGTRWGPRCQFRLEIDNVALPKALLVFAQSQAIRISLTGCRWFGPSFSLFKFPKLLRPISLPGWNIPPGCRRQRWQKDLCMLQVHILGMRSLLLFPPPMRGRGKVRSCLLTLRGLL